MSESNKLSSEVAEHVVEEEGVISHIVNGSAVEVASQWLVPRVLLDRS